MLRAERRRKTCLACDRLIQRSVQGNSENRRTSNQQISCRLCQSGIHFFQLLLFVADHLTLEYSQDLLEERFVSEELILRCD